MKMEVPTIRVIFSLPSGESVIFDDQITAPMPGEFVQVNKYQGYVNHRMWTFDPGMTAVMVKLIDSIHNLEVTSE